MHIINQHTLDFSNNKKNQLVATLEIENEKNEKHTGILLYSYYENEVDLYSVEKDIHKHIPGFYETGFYFENYLVEDESKKYILLKRNEFSLSKYNLSIKENDNLDLVSQYIRKHTFYDALIIEGKNLFIVENHVEDNMMTYKELNKMLKENNDQVYVFNMSDTTQKIDDFSFNSNYIFEYGMYIRNNKKIKKSIINIANEKGLNHNQVQLMKIYDFYIHSTASIKDIIEKDYVAYESTIEKTFYNLFKDEIIKDYVISEFNLPNSYKKINDVEHLDLLLKTPLVENLWSTGTVENFFNIRCYKKYIDNTVSTNDFLDEEMRQSLMKFYQNITFKELQKLDVIYSKKTNNLLKGKMDIVQSGRQEEDLYISVFDLFTNKDNLQTFVKNIPNLKIYEAVKYDSVFTVSILSEFIKKEHYLKYDILSVKREIDTLKKKNKRIDVNKMVNRLYTRVHRCRTDVDKRHTSYISLTGEEVSDILLKVFASREILEKSYLQLFEEITKDYGLSQDELIMNHFSYKKTNLDVFHEHFTDILNTYFLMYYIYENELYSEKLKPYFNKFFTSSFSNFKKFEEGIRNLEGVLKSGELSRTLPLEPFVYPSNLNEYTMKQPINGFELKYIGDTMHHCVFSYFDKLISNNNTTYIVSIFKENEPIVCIEVRNKRFFNSETSLFEDLDKKEIVQAKLKYNSPVFNNKELNDIVLEFAQLNDLEISTQDVK